MSAKTKISDWASGRAKDGGFYVDGKYLTADELGAAEAAAREAKEPEARQKLPMELFVKAGPSGEDIGDCPFAHFVMMVLAFKGLSYKMTPCSPESKPSWLVDGYDGKMPCLLHDGEAHTESLTIARYINFFDPKPYLEPCSDAANAATSPFFPALASFIKNTDEDADDALRATLVKSLAVLDSYIESSGNLYLDGGSSLGLGDCSLAPKLWHLKIAGNHFKNFEVPSEFSSLSAYMEKVFAEKCFKETACPEETVLWGWGNARGSG